MNTTIQSCLLIFAICLLISCADDAPPPVSRVISSTTSEKDSGKGLAKRISLKLLNTDFRLNLKSKLLEKFDGDFNVLASSVSGITPDENDPLVQIAMPSLSGLKVEDWNAAKDIPIVIFRPESANLETLTHLTAYDKGEAFLFDITKEPDRHVLVISHNERILYSDHGKLPAMLSDRACRINPLLSDENYDYYLKQDIYDCSNEVAKGTTEDDPDGCDRDMDKKHDYVRRARFATINIMRQAEHYLDGNPEVFFVITLASKNPSGFSSLRKSYPSSDRSEWKDCGIFKCDTEWYDKSIPVFNWDRSLFGELVRYDWFEEDYSKAKIDLTLGLSTKILDVSVSGGVKITINEKDYFLDQDFVSYCDQVEGFGTTYNTGKLLFSVNKQ